MHAEKGCHLHQLHQSANPNGKFRRRKAPLTDLQPGKPLHGGLAFGVAVCEALEARFVYHPHRSLAFFLFPSIKQVSTRAQLSAKVRVCGLIQRPEPLDAWVEVVFE